MSELQELKRRESELSDSLNEVRNKIREIENAAFSEKTGVHVGSLVKLRDGKVFRVSKINTNICGWLKGSLRKKDGSFSEQERDIYQSYEVIS